MLLFCLKNCIGAVMLLLESIKKEKGMKKTLITAIMALFVAVMVMAEGATETSGAAYPNRPVELVAPASAGGGTDTFCRLIVDIIQKNDLIDGNVVVINKPGGGGTVGAAYAIDPGRDSDYTLIALNGAQALGLRASKEVNASDLTPIAALAMDNVLFVGSEDSEYKSFNDVIRAAKANPGELAIGVADNLDRLCVELISQEIGLDVTSVYFDSAGEISSAMLGGHIDFGIMNPNECLGQIEGNMMVPLASFSNERLEGLLSDAPTFAELGYPEIEFQMFRGIMGGPDMSADVQSYWADVFEKVAATDQWKTDYINKRSLDGRYMGAEKFGPYSKENSEQLYVQGQKIGLFD